MRELAEQRRRFGYRRLHVLLEREGLVVNHKRTERLYREEGLQLRRRRHKKRAACIRVPMPQPIRPNQHWSMDFVTDSLWQGRRFRVLTIVDDFSRECLATVVDSSINGLRVSQVLEELGEARGLPEAITVDNGPEFAGRTLDEWAFRTKVKLDFIRPGKPVENAYIESFNGKFREECLNDGWFKTMPEARATIEEWRIDYNRNRPHSSLENLTPEAFARRFSMARTATTNSVESFLTTDQ